MNEFLSKLQKLFPQTRGMPDLGVIWRQYECMKFFRFQKCGSYNQQLCPTTNLSFASPHAAGAGHLAFVTGFPPVSIFKGDHFSNQCLRQAASTL